MLERAEKLSSYSKAVVREIGTDDAQRAAIPIDRHEGFVIEMNLLS